MAARAVDADDRVECELRADRVFLGGRAALYMQGHIMVDDALGEAILTGPSSGADLLAKAVSIAP